MLKIAICEDDKDQINYIYNILKNDISKNRFLVDITLYFSGEELLEHFNSNPNEYDIVFLDINMKALNGIETAKVIRKKNTTLIIVFITGVADFVFDGYDVRAFNYILKPINEKKLLKVFHETFSLLITPKKTDFIFNSKNVIHKVEYDDIFYFFSDKRIINIVCKNNNCLKFYGNLNDIENEIFSNDFIRCHRRYLVNIQKIKNIIPNKVIIENDTNIPISRSRYKATVFAFAKKIIR